MLNIFYNFSYIEKKRVFLTKKLRYSVFLNLIFKFSYKFKIPLSDNFLFSGPEKRFNNLLKTFDSKEYYFHKLTTNNTYIVQFDKYGENVLNSILRLHNFANQKILIGPLYDLEWQKKLIDYIKKYPNIKLLVASQKIFENFTKEMKYGLDGNNVKVCPAGVISEKQLLKNSKLKNREEKCLIYFKNRSREDLEKITNYLNRKNIEHKLFEYGKYRNKDLKKAAKKYRYGICLDRTESQGFAIQEILSCNLPLIVWEDHDLNSQVISDYFQVKNLTGTSVPYWSSFCGEKVGSYDEFVQVFDIFHKNLNNYEPYKLVNEYLTYEKVEEAFIKIFREGYINGNN
jgi:hypothetical protein